MLVRRHLQLEYIEIFNNPEFQPICYLINPALDNYLSQVFDITTQPQRQHPCGLAPGFGIA